MSLFGESWKSIIIEQKFKKFDFFKMSQLLTPTMIIENTRLGKVVSLPKGLERCFNAQDENKLILYINDRIHHLFLSKCQGLSLALNILS